MGIDFQSEAKRIHASDRPFDGQLQTIIARENEFQNERAAQGGTCETTLSESTQIAVDAILKRRAAARGSLSRPVVKTGTA